MKKMFISDAYLPMNMNALDRYKFSLVFPMGVTINGNKLIVSMCVGDFYAVIMEFDLNEVIALCKYDVSHMDMNEYNYKYLVKLKDKTFVDTKFNNKIALLAQSGGTDKNNYFKKYLKYKNKYINAKNLMVSIK
ncbi:hypothetical protein QJ857_gp0814 [Tupanvirus soda lake]|uniref:Uncharacterized protein n=2 Tax=Tupanvirus TaxID=2094720 RepID=A0A6N1NL22_9VIRU|nr:hypothetical protein QJ857_gp0814 [Tupanvirus soda lake]QKU35235.1 hypothetical protein [Tupanvirus soda lake]